MSSSASRIRAFASAHPRGRAVVAVMGLAMVTACDRSPVAADGALAEKVSGLEKRNAELEARLAATESETGHEAASLPASLDGFYPDGAQELPYLGAMMGMAGPMMTIGVALQSKDAEGAKTAFGQFRQAYEETSRMVPEWQGMFPAAPVDALGKALESGDPQQVATAMQKAGEVCSTCHHTYMPMVQLRYRWGDFAKIQVPDPMGGPDPVGWPPLMMGLEAAMTGVGYHLQGGRTDAAVQSIGALRGMMKTLADSCETCHPTKRTYFVDAETVGLLDTLEATVTATEPDPAKIQEVLGSFAQESCAKCHLVHIPAAFARHGAG